MYNMMYVFIERNHIKFLGINYLERVNVTREPNPKLIKFLVSIRLIPQQHKEVYTYRIFRAAYG